MKGLRQRRISQSRRRPQSPHKRVYVTALVRHTPPPGKAHFTLTCSCDSIRKMNDRHSEIDSSNSAAGPCPSEAPGVTLRPDGAFSGLVFAPTSRGWVRFAPLMPSRRTISTGAASAKVASGTHTPKGGVLKYGAVYFPAVRIPIVMHGGLVRLSVSTVSGDQLLHAVELGGRRCARGTEYLLPAIHDIGLRVCVRRRGVYYVVGRQILIFLRVWDEELANYSFKQLRYARRGYRVTPKPRRKRRDKA